ncbi:MAG: hypothetical protein ACC646_12230 [Paracoccaceae bacterium]
MSPYSFFEPKPLARTAGVAKNWLCIGLDVLDGKIALASAESGLGLAFNGITKCEKFLFLINGNFVRTADIRTKHHIDPKRDA